APAADYGAAGERDLRHWRAGGRYRHYRRGGDGLGRGEPPRADGRGLAPAGGDGYRDGPLARDRADAGDDRRGPKRDGHGGRSPGWHRGGGTAARLQGRPTGRAGSEGVRRPPTPSTEGVWKSRS